MARLPSRQSRSIAAVTGGTGNEAPVSAKMPSFSAETSMLTRSPALITRPPGMPWAISSLTLMHVAPGNW
ncbi:hypothetical protein D3C87_2119950 [compost metagenome]